MTKDNPWLPGNPEALPGVGSSDLRPPIFGIIHKLTFPHRKLRDTEVRSRSPLKPPNSSWSLQLAISSETATRLASHRRALKSVAADQSASSQEKNPQTTIRWRWRIIRGPKPHRELSQEHVSRGDAWWSNLWTERCGRHCVPDLPTHVARPHSL